MVQTGKSSTSAKNKGRKTRSKRSEIPHATCKRVIKEASILENTRVSKDALNYTNEHLKEFVVELGAKCADLLKVFKGKRVTISPEILIEILRPMEHTHGIKPTDIAVPSSGHYDSVLPKAGIARLFNKGSGNHRAEGGVRIMTVQAAEAYLRYIGREASAVVQNRKETTIMMKDILFVVKSS